MDRDRFHHGAGGDDAGAGIRVWPKVKIRFGIVSAMNIPIYFPSPPFGPACVWLKSAAPKDVTRQERFAAPPPVIVLRIVGLARVMICPHIALRPSEALAQCQRRPHDRTRQR
ncbi:MAG: hypothetical protein ACJA1L_001559 [Paracoccaceae bacterium]|jgi:hypothetical protein